MRLLETGPRFPYLKVMKTAQVAVLVYFTCLHPAAVTVAAPGTFFSCTDYHCDQGQDVSLSEKQWQDIRLLFSQTTTPAEERQHIREAIALFEKQVGRLTGTWRDLAKNAARTGGPISGRASLNAQGPGPSFAVNMADVQVDTETGRSTVTAFTAIQDAGRAIHPDYVEGQMQGGAAQGIGWALNEEYIYDESGVLENAGFLDYRIPVASDLPMIDAQIIEVPNPTHPYGVRGVGETPIVAPLAAIGNAVSRALGQRMTDLPLSPPKVLAAIDSNT